MQLFDSISGNRFWLVHWRWITSENNSQAISWIEARVKKLLIERFFAQHKENVIKSWSRWMSDRWINSVNCLTASPVHYWSSIGNQFDGFNSIELWLQVNLIESIANATRDSFHAWLVLITEFFNLLFPLFLLTARFTTHSSCKSTEKSCRSPGRD